MGIYVCSMIIFGKNGDMETININDGCMYVLAFSLICLKQSEAIFEKKYPFYSLKSVLIIGVFRPLVS